MIQLNKELESAAKNGTDKLEVYEKFAEISQKNREEAVAKSCSGDPFCASGVLAEAEAGTDVATSLRRLPIFSSLSSEDLSQLDRFVLAENEESARAIYQSLPEYVKVALYTKEVGETIGFGAAVGGKGLSALGVIGKGSKQSYQPNQGAVGNMGEFFRQPGFGSQMKETAQKTSQVFQGQNVTKRKNLSEIILQKVISTILMGCIKTTLKFLIVQEQKLKPFLILMVLLMMQKLKQLKLKVEGCQND